MDPDPTTAALLQQVWRDLGGTDRPAVRIDPVPADAAMPALLPSRLPVLPAMLAAVAASTAAAGALFAARGGDPGEVVVDPVHVSLAARSERYAALVGGVPTTSMFAPLSRFWPTAD